MIQVLIADDYAPIREALRLILAQTPDLRAVGEASDENGVLEKIRAVRFDLVLLDLSMPGKGWAHTITEIQHERPSLPILVVSMYSVAQYGPAVVAAGARGFVTKSRAAEELIGAIRTVLSGHTYISRDAGNDPRSIHLTSRRVNESGAARTKDHGID